MNAPNVVIPSDHEFVETPDGWEVRKRYGASTSKTLSVRLTTEDYVSLVPFAETFPNSSMGIGLRWLLCHPKVREVIRERVAAVLATPTQPATQEGET